jgi:hypothetical protein
MPMRGTDGFTDRSSFRSQLLEDKLCRPGGALNPKPEGWELPSFV